MSLKSSNQVEKNRCQLEIEVAADVFNSAIERAYKKQRNRISIPGFRKGKAPRAFIEKYYGAEVFYDDAINDVYPNALEDAVKSAGIEMIQDKVDFDLVSANKETGLNFKVTVTTKPVIEIDNYKGIEIDKNAVSVTVKDVNEELKKVQDRNSRMVTVADRKAKKDDIVEIDFEGFVDDKAFDGGKAENYSLTLGSGNFIPGFEDQIIGHSTGDEFDVNVTFPEDYQAENLKEKAAVFKVKLHEIKVKELPELDDEFAKDVSDFDTLADYKADLKKKLHDSREKQADQEVDSKLVDALVAEVKGDIPEAMYNNRVNDDMNEFASRLQSQGLNIESYMKYTGMNLDAMRKSMRPQAEKQVKLRLALEKIAELESIEPSAEDVDKEYQKIADAYKMEIDKVKNIISEDDIKNDVKSEKAMTYVKDNAKITVKKATKTTKKAAEKKADTDTQEDKKDDEKKDNE